MKVAMHTLCGNFWKPMACCTNAACDWPAVDLRVLVPHGSRRVQAVTTLPSISTGVCLSAVPGAMGGKWEAWRQAEAGRGRAAESTRWG